MAYYAPGEGSWESKRKNEDDGDAQQPPTKRVKSTAELPNDELFYFDSGSGSPRNIVPPGVPASLPAGHPASLIGQINDTDDLNGGARSDSPTPPLRPNDPFAGPAAEFISVEDFSTAEYESTSPEAYMEDGELAPEPVVFSSRIDLKRKREEFLPAIIAEWRPRSSQDPTPWLKDAVRFANSASGLNRLHHEMFAFFDFVKPRRVDKLVRTRIATEIDAALCGRFPLSACLFGSSATGLFLPNADLDMVAFSHQFTATRGSFTPNVSLFAVRERLFQTGLADKNHMEVINKARVPIVKFVESDSQFSVDISFNNTSGLQAVRKLVLEWLDLYPALPILVLILKQFLLMRRMDEPKDGYMGGLTITCLVVNFLKYHPLGLAYPEFGYGGERFHLGKLLLDFFDFYGNRFSMTNMGIDMELGYFQKATPESKWMVLNWWDKRDISGGTRMAPVIASSFARAYQDLTSMIAKFDSIKANSSDKKVTNDISILGVILAGNYKHYQDQRNHNDNLWRRMTTPRERAGINLPMRLHG
jgi:hypothetical protein